eukprot:752456-Hanusia_phi.AAC.2
MKGCGCGGNEMQMRGERDADARGTRCRTHSQHSTYMSRYQLVSSSIERMISSLAIHVSTLRYESEDSRGWYNGHGGGSTVHIVMLKWQCGWPSPRITPITTRTIKRTGMELSALKLALRSLRRG